MSDFCTAEEIIYYSLLVKTFRFVESTKILFSTNQEFTDFQFRLNLYVAMTFAGEFFDPTHAVKCLVDERCQFGEIGMKTFDTDDYRPYYHSSDESSDFYISKGFNYSNGPKFV